MLTVTDTAGVVTIACDNRASILIREMLALQGMGPTVEDLEASITERHALAQSRDRVQIMHDFSTLPEADQRKYREEIRGKARTKPPQGGGGPP